MGNLLDELQKELLKLLKPSIEETVAAESEPSQENEDRTFYTPTESVTRNTTQNSGSNVVSNNAILIVHVQTMTTGEILAGTVLSAPRSSFKKTKL